MNESKEPLEHNLLDLLIDGASSFVALYGALIRVCGYPVNMSVSEVMNTLIDMERRKLVNASKTAEDGSLHKLTDEDWTRLRREYIEFFAESDLEDLSLDEVGLWYEITVEGKAKWKQSVNDEGPLAHGWAIDDLADTQTIVIHAKTKDIAQAALDWWLSRNRPIELLNDKVSTESISEFKLQDGSTINDGVRITYRYRPMRSR